MARIVGFDQDPDSPDGTGLFHFDSGQSVLAHDPETAAQFQQPDPSIVEAAQPGPDMRLAANGNVDLGDIDAPATRQGVTTVENVQPPNQPAMAVEQGQPQQMPGPAVSANPYVGQEAALQRYVDAPVRVAATKGGFKPKSATETVETEHSPVTQEDIDARRELADNAMYAHVATLGNQAQRAQNEATALKAQMPVLAAKEAATRAAADQIDNQYKQERARIKKMADDFDPNKFYHDKGTGGTIALALAQGLGAFASIRSGGPNFAHQIVQDAVNRDIAAQKDKQGSALKQLEMTLGDKQQAEAAYRLIHDQKVAQQAAAFAADAKSQDATDAAHEFLQANQLQQAKDEQEFRDRAFGKHTKKLEEAYTAPSRGGLRAPTEDEKHKRIATAQGVANVVKTQAETDKTITEATGAEKPAELAKRLVSDGHGGQVVARTEVEGTKLREADGFRAQAVSAAQRVAELSTLGAGMSPTQRRQRDAAIEQLINSANSLAGQGVVRGDDIERWKSVLGGPWSPGAAEVAKQIADTAEQAYQMRVDSQMGAAAGESYAGGRPRPVYSGAPALTPSRTPKSAQRIGE